MSKESQVKGYEEQDDSDIRDQPFQKSVSKEREIYTDDDGYHRRHVQPHSYPSAHPIALRALAYMPSIPTLLGISRSTLPPVSPLANIITLGVRDIASMRGFYLHVGWPAVFDSEEFVVFELRGVLLALFPVTQLAADARTTAGVSRDGIRFSIIINVETPEKVDAMVARFRDAGGSVSKEPTEAEFFDGRSAYVSDPESNFWEITWTEPGNAVLAAARRAAGLD